MKNDDKLAAGWLHKAENDLHAIAILVAGGGPGDAICFHAQQAVEKALKSILAFAGKEIPRSHDLDYLHRLVQLAHPSLEVEVDDLEVLAPYSVQVRYDLEFLPETQRALEAQSIAVRILTIVTKAIVGSAPPDGRSEDDGTVAYPNAE